MARSVPTRRRIPRGSPEEITPELQLQPSCMARLRVTLAGAAASRKAMHVVFISPAARLLPCRPDRRAQSRIGQVRLAEWWLSSGRNTALSHDVAAQGMLVAFDADAL